MAVVNTNVNASVAQNALTRNRAGNEYGNGAPIYWPTHQQRI